MLALVLISAAMVWVYTWIMENPGRVRSLVAQLKRQWRQYLNHQKGQQAADRVGDKLQVWAAKKKLDSKLVDQVWAEHRDEIARQLGTKITDKFLGEPTSLERYS